jgi:hypothetical protein
MQTYPHPQPNANSDWSDWSRICSRLSFVKNRTMVSNLLLPKFGVSVSPTEPYSFVFKTGPGPNDLSPYCRFSNWLIVTSVFVSNIRDTIFIQMYTYTSLSGEVSI